MIDSILDATERRRLALEPTTQDEAWQLCVDIARLNLHGVKTPEDGLARVLTGRSLGLPAMASIQGIAIIWNKSAETHTTVMYAKLKLALLQSRKDVIEYIRPVELTNQKATWVGKRKGEGEKEFSYSFTIQDAEIAGLVNRGGSPEARAANNYTRHPGPMLQWRACGRLADLIASDVLFGIATREEVEDELRQQEETAAEIAKAPPIGRLEKALADKPMPPPPPARDFAVEAADLKEKILAAATSKDKGGKARVRETFKAFEASAPAELVDEVKRFYNLAVGAQKKVDVPVAANGSGAQATLPSPDPVTGEREPGEEG
jgi:hypothetical protein